MDHFSFLFSKNNPHVQQVGAQHNAITKLRLKCPFKYFTSWGGGGGAIKYNQGPRTVGWQNLYRYNNYRARSEPLNGYRILFSSPPAPAIILPFIIIITKLTLDFGYLMTKMALGIYSPTLWVLFLFFLQNAIMLNNGYLVK
jgi:hypothetical protein